MAGAPRAKYQTRQPRFCAVQPASTAPATAPTGAPSQMTVMAEARFWVG